MSEEDVSRLVGRLAIEKAEAARRRAAIERELEVVQKTITRAFDGMARGNQTEQILAELAPVGKFVSVDGLRALLEERDGLNSKIGTLTRQLRELGID